MDDYSREIEHWRAQRIARLTAPDGWLSLTGLHWLEPGPNTLGSAADNAIVLAKAPAHLGTIEWRDDDTMILRLASDGGVLVDGETTSETTVRDDRESNPTRVSFGSVNFVVIDRGGRKALRVRDGEAATRTQFAGIESFRPDPSWRIVADWVPFDPPHTLETANVIGQMERYPVPGKAVFERDGRRHELLPVIEVPGDTQLFLIFADGTSGRETYGAARFLYADPPRDGRIVLDFNKAYNPPCAFTAFATCPLAPPENRLDLRVTAGEKKYRGSRA
ncbi:MAG TPA: DUF1684 domain-containing protein [Rhodanobacteraceae bacterium]